MTKDASSSYYIFRFRVLDGSFVGNLYLSRCLWTQGASRILLTFLSNRFWSGRGFQKAVWLSFRIPTSEAFKCKGMQRNKSKVILIHRNVKYFRYYMIRFQLLTGRQYSIFVFYVYWFNCLACCSRGTWEGSYHSWHQLEGTEVIILIVSCFNALTLTMDMLDM